MVRGREGAGVKGKPLGALEATHRAPLQGEDCGEDPCCLLLGIHPPCRQQATRDKSHSGSRIQLDKLAID